MTIEITADQHALIHPIFCVNMVVGVGRYYSTEDEGEIIKDALICFGFLIKSVKGVHYSFEDFAKIIEDHYSDKNLKTKAAIDTLRAVGARSREIASGNHSYELRG